MTTHECVHLVTCSYFWSRKKDGGHAIQFAVGENPMLNAHFATVFYKRGVLGHIIFTLR